MSEELTWEDAKKLEWEEGDYKFPREQWRYMLLFDDNGVRLAVFRSAWEQGDCLVEAPPIIFNLRDLPNGVLSYSDLRKIGFAVREEGGVREIDVGPLSWLDCDPPDDLPQEH